MENKLSESAIVCLFEENKLPESWDFSYQLTYLDFFNIFAYLDQKNLPNNDILSAIKSLNGDIRNDL